MKTPHESFDDALDAAIDAIRHGQSLDVVLAAHSLHAYQLRPLLDTAITAGGPAAVAVDTCARIASNFGVVRGPCRPREHPSCIPADVHPAFGWR